MEQPKLPRFAKYRHLTCGIYPHHSQIQDGFIQNDKIVYIDSNHIDTSKDH